MHKAARLQEEKAYSRVFSNARRSRDKLFTVLYCSNDDSGAGPDSAISNEEGSFKSTARLGSARSSEEGGFKSKARLGSARSNEEGGFKSKARLGSARSNEEGGFKSKARLGLAISKKNCRLAVGRNRIKRIVRESFRLHQHELAGLDLVVLNKQNTHQATNRALLKSLEKHWQHCHAESQNRAGYRA